MELAESVEEGVELAMSVVKAVEERFPELLLGGVNAEI